MAHDSSVPLPLKSVETLLAIWLKRLLIIPHSQDNFQEIAYGHSGSEDSKIKLLSSSYKGTGEKELPWNWFKCCPWWKHNRNNLPSFCIEKLSMDNTTWIVHRHNKYYTFFRKKKKKINFRASCVFWTPSSCSAQGKQGTTEQPE